MYGTDAILLALSGDDIVIDMRPVQQACSVHIQHDVAIGNKTTSH